ncbi:GAF domain-containing protein [candidate division KSB1 bacterium]|nr:GAF domain-containing protein [candidate division KSB1 bacterium]
MPFLTLITILGHGFATALNAILVFLSARKVGKRFDDYAFGAVLLAALLWHGGNFLYRLFNLLFGAVAVQAADLLKIVAYLGLLFLPSALLHVHYAIYSRLVYKRFGKKHWIVLSVVYLVTVPFIALSLQEWPHVETAEHVARLFALWCIVSIFMSVYLSLRFSRAVQDKADYFFYKSLRQILIAIGAGLFLVYIIPLYKLPYIGSYLNLIPALSPAFPMAVLSYYIYRYNFYRLVIKPSLIYSIIYGSVMAIYLLGIRRFGEYLQQFPDIHSRFIEGLLLVALVFAFQPLRIRMQEKLDKFFFKGRYYYQQYLRELTDSISRIVDLEVLMQTISNALTRALRAKACSLVVFHYSGHSFKIVKSMGSHQLTDIYILRNALKQTRHLDLRRQIRTQRVRKAMQYNRIELAIPIYSQDKITGLISLTAKQTGNPYSDEEIDVLQTFAHQVGLVMDNAKLVQDRLQLEEKVFQSEKMKTMGELATTIAHEMKNPLSSIKTIVQVLLEKAKGEEAEDLKMVVSEINRLNAVLEKLLRFAHPSSGHLQVVNLEETVEQVVSLLKREAESRSVNINRRIEPGRYPVLASQNMLREIVFNLIHNAIHAAGSDGRVVIGLKKITAIPENSLVAGGVDSGKEGWFCLSVQDTGVGISKSDFKKIFEPFYTTKTVGTGLGLTIVKRNVERIGGAIQINSAFEKGTEFCVILNPKWSQNGERKNTFS